MLKNIYMTPIMGENMERFALLPLSITLINTAKMEVVQNLN